MKKEFQEKEKEIREETPPFVIPRTLMSLLSAYTRNTEMTFQHSFVPPMRKPPLTFKKRPLITLGPA
jgi:hypothetical protein